MVGETKIIGLDSFAAQSTGVASCAVFDWR